ncbi:serine/threonine-protein kinase [Methylobacterium sp. NFXW15]|uniref:serine/threonine-protein kinase n=1 Tax=Methylobacterium sp. NFXW15 TaxID=2819512 RepID=UPI003CEE6628
MLNPIDIACVSFREIQEIGADGRNSRTFIAHDNHLDARIVIKSMLKAGMASFADFFSESRILYLSSHPNVCQVHYACYNNDQIFIAMPLYNRGSLKQWMSREFLTIREIIVAGCQILSGLSNIHSKGLIHFDIKPDNILLSDRGEALVADFGQAKQIDLNGQAAQDRLYYKTIPPEAFQGTASDRRFDIYQFGLLLYRLCNGNDDFYQQLSRFENQGVFDFPSFRQAVIDGAFPDRNKFLPHVPQALRRAIQTCLAPDAANRFQSAIAVSNSLATIGCSRLDWRYDPAGDKQTWVKNVKGTTVEFIRNSDGSTEMYRISAGGNRQRVKKEFKAAASDAQVRTILGQY